MKQTREDYLRPVRGRSYTGPMTRSYPEPTEEQQAANLKRDQAKGRNTRRVK
jgi:hypothetical protein